MIGPDLNIPLNFPRGEVLIDASMYDKFSVKDVTIHYSTLDLPLVTASINISFCNCTESIGDIALRYKYERHIQFWKVHDVPIVVTGPALYEGEDTKNNPSRQLGYEFVIDGFRISIGTDQSFDTAMDFILGNFFNADLSALERMNMGMDEELLIEGAKKSKEYALLAKKYSEPYIVEVFERTNVITFASSWEVEGTKSGYVEVTGFIDPVSGSMTESFAGCYLEFGSDNSIREFSEDDVMKFIEQSICIDIYERTPHFKSLHK
ncbi:MAG: hypothetical protein QXP61_10435 [Nitrososphaerales archaeon]